MSSLAGDIRGSALISLPVPNEKYAAGGGAAPSLWIWRARLYDSQLYRAALLELLRVAARAPLEIEHRDVSLGINYAEIEPRGDLAEHALDLQLLLDRDDA